MDLSKLTKLTELNGSFVRIAKEHEKSDARLKECFIHKDFKGMETCRMEFHELIDQTIDNMISIIRLNDDS